MGALFLVIGVGLAAYLAVAKSSPPPATPPAPSDEPAEPPPQAPAAIIAPSSPPLVPVTIATVDPSSEPPAAVVSTIERHDPRCGPGQQWADDLSSHDQAGAGEGCYTPGADGGLVRQGTWTYRGVDSLLHTGDYVDGREEGTWLTLYADHRKAEEAMYHGGVIDGWQTLWDPDGYKIAERHYKNGVLDGTVTITYPNGVVIKEEWRDGVRIDPPAAP